MTHECLRYASKPYFGTPDLLDLLIERVEKLRDERRALAFKKRQILAEAATYITGYHPPTFADCASTFIYFVEAAGSWQVKIGFSSTPEKRLSGLQTGSSHPLTLLGFIPGTRHDERAWQATFSSKRLNGEWFRLDSELRHIIEASIAGWRFLDRLAAVEDEFRLITEDIDDVFHEMRLGGFDTGCAHGVLGIRGTELLYSRPRSLASSTYTRLLEALS